MPKFLITVAAITAFFATAGSASALPGTANNAAVDSPVSKVAICFYLDGWNGPGFYECGYRYRRGHGWHGKQHHSRRYHHSGKHYSKPRSKHHSSKRKHR